MKFKDKNFKDTTFEITTGLYNEIIRLSKLQGMKKNQFVENFIDEYLSNFKDGDYSIQVNDFEDRDKKIFLRTTIELNSSIKSFCASRKINLGSFLYFIMSAKLSETKEEIKHLSEEKEDEGVLNKSFVGIITDEEIKKAFYELKKRGRPSSEDVLNRYTDEGRVVNTFSDLKLNDIIYFIPNPITKVDNKKVTIMDNLSTSFELPCVEKIKIRSFELRGKFIMINRESYNSSNFELELTIDEYYNEIKVSKTKGFYSCVKSVYEEARNKIRENEIESRLEQINKLNVEIDLLKQITLHSC